MKLIKFRIRCLEGMEDSGWLTVGAGATLLHGRSGDEAGVVLQALQHINPLGDPPGGQGFAAPLTHVRQSGYLRKILPGKRTAAIAVFAADVELVRELSGIDADLLEMDRIEVGRRLDYSRWLNFVEISSSSRWSEIAGTMLELRRRLADRRPPQSGNPDRSLFANLMDTDRLRGDVAESLKRWLAEAEALPGVPVDAGLTAGIAACRRAVERSERFAGAKRLVADRLPRFVSLRPGATCRSLAIAIDDLGPPGHGGKGDDQVVPLLAGLWRKTARVGPVARRRQLLQQDLDEAAAELDLLAADLGVACPRFVVTDSSIGIDRTRHPHGPAAGRIMRILTVLLLCRALHGQMPIFLLDGLESGLNQPDRDTVIAFIQRLGGICQLVHAAASPLAADDSGWSAVLDLTDKRKIGRAGGDGPEKDLSWQSL